jgi:hypothetical protein
MPLIDFLVGSKPLVHQSALGLTRWQKNCLLSFVLCLVTLRRQWLSANSRGA